MRDEMMASMLQTLEKHLSTETIVGKPLTIGDITLIPVMDLMFGYGGGWGEAPEDNQKGSSSGSGGGAGARLSAKALVVIRGSEVQVLPLSKGGTLEKILDALPDLVEKFKQPKAGEPEAKDE